MSTYHDLMLKLAKIAESRKIHLGLSRMEKLLELLGNPHKSYLTIHVGGTNGKGSTATKLAAILSLSGYKTGLYTSPHLLSFKERIVIDEMQISENQCSSCLQEIFTVMDQFHIDATYFEITTALCFLFFKKMHIDVAVIEVGMGGKEDATNVITPLLSIITSVSLEHTAFLGDTIAAITLQKAGIIKPHIPVVIGPKVDRKLIESVAKKLHSFVHQVTTDSLLFDDENKEIARSAVSYLKKHFTISDEAVQKGLQIKPKARFEVLKKEWRDQSSIKTLPSVVIFDVAHNPAGIAKLLTCLEATYPKRSKVFLCGFSKGKDIQSCVQLLEKHYVLLTTADHPRLMTYLELQAALPNEIIYRNIVDALVCASLEAISANAILILTGSFFFVAKCRELLGSDEPCDQEFFGERL